MKALRDPDHLLRDGLAEIRAQFQLPAAAQPAFTPAVLAAAEAAVERAARQAPTAHVDRTAWPFITLDPASATDLDQAFTIERTGADDLLLHYAIADVAWFVADGDALDAEAWRRGVTTYLPDGKVSLYPPAVSERAASLLPDGTRPSVLFSVRVAPDGAVRLVGAERALIHSRAKLAYDTVRDDQLPPDFGEFARRMAVAEAARGAARVDPPEQVVERAADGRFSLHLRPQALAEQRNAAMSLAANMAIADALHAAGTGLFRVMAGPGERALVRLRITATAFGLDWPVGLSLADFERRLDVADPRAQAFQLAVRRAGDGAGYEPYRPGQRPWHSALSATYAHATAPLRRLADRYVIRATLAVANGQPVPAEVTAAFERLGTVMARAEDRASQVERAVIDLAETAILAGREGEVFRAVVTDADAGGARIQLCELPVLARARADGLLPGAPVQVRLDRADTRRRQLQFTQVS